MKVKKHITGTIHFHVGRTYLKQRTMYWAGPRCFVASLRHFDFKTIGILEKDYDWIVYNPVQLVKEEIKNNKEAPLFGKNGVIRKTCLEYVGKSDIIVAYTGLIWDTGTSREVEFAFMQEKPILAWSDSSVIYAETFEEENGVINGEETEKLKTIALPFNAMDLVFDRYLRLNKLYCKSIEQSKSEKSNPDSLHVYDLKEEELAEKVNKEATNILNARLSKRQ